MIKKLTISALVMLTAGFASYNALVPVVEGSDSFIKVPGVVSKDDRLTPPYLVYTKGDNVIAESKSTSPIFSIEADYLGGMTTGVIILSPDKKTIKFDTSILNNADPGEYRFVASFDKNGDGVADEAKAPIQVRILEKVELQNLMWQQNIYTFNKHHTVKNPPNLVLASSAVEFKPADITGITISGINVPTNMYELQGGRVTIKAEFLQGMEINERHRVTVNYYKELFVDFSLEVISEEQLGNSMAVEDGC